MPGKHQPRGWRRQILRRLLAAVRRRARHDQAIIGPGGTGKSSAQALLRARLDALGIAYEEQTERPGLVTFSIQPAPAAPAASPPWRGEPRDLRPYELANWQCPSTGCGRAAAKGTHSWEDRGPYQQLSNHRLECPLGHRWTNSTDGG
ncbi:hypothetical protein ACIOG4_28560 [Streptomyces microflavus]|uniref:hypothetical protein n=1 Tax=Streptomyces microflavus TaxID=1919 RepID=UPI0038165861